LLAPTQLTPQTLENNPSTTFWTTLAQAFETHARDAAKNSSFVQQTLGAGYPRLLRLFHEFFSKIAVHTDTVYSAVQQRCVSRCESRC